MTLPRTDILLARIRQEADIVDDNSLSDFILTNYMNDAQRTIQNVIFKSDQSNNAFVAREILTAVSGQIEYSLPIDVFADASIIDVHSIDSNNRPKVKYEKMGLGEAGLSYGYSIENQKIIFNHAPTDNILVRYNYRMPLMGKRAGGISGVVGQVITMTGILTGWEDTTEWVTIVDKYGTIIAQGLYINTFASPDLTVVGDLTGVTTDHYVIAGKVSSSHSFLPEDCETYLKTFVTRKIHAHINSKKIANSAIFTREEREEIEELFADRHSDIEYPLITDFDYLDV